MLRVWRIACQIQQHGFESALGHFARQVTGCIACAIIQSCFMAHFLHVFVDALAQVLQCNQYDLAKRNRE